VFVGDPLQRTPLDETRLYNGGDNSYTNGRRPVDVNLPL
jgi:hypothetical protein